MKAAQRSFLRSAGLFAVLGFLVSALASCATTEEVGGRSDMSWRERLVASAEALKGHPYDSALELKGRHFRLDCVGFLSAVLWRNGINLDQEMSHYRGDAVNRFKELLESKHAFFEKPRPQPGDFVFWDNTWDANGDGIIGDDGTTHAGMVVSVDSDGTVTYIHASVTRGIALAKLNRDHPHHGFSPTGKLWNSPMYLGSMYGRKNNPPHWLSGDLCSGIADAEALL